MGSIKALGTILLASALALAGCSSKTPAPSQDTAGPKPGDSAPKPPDKKITLTIEYPKADDATNIKVTEYKNKRFQQK
jgi:ABC-type glycerol-3-phosphate transport system substrate-binding protein